MIADLHIHTNISDGSFGIEEVIESAKRNNLTHIAITNHDTVRGLQEYIEYGEREGIKVIPGIEISACDLKSKKKIHILGYNFNLEGKSIRKLCDPVLERRHKNSLWQIEQLVNNNYKIKIENILSKAKESKVIYKQHIMEELIENGYTDKVYSELYRELFKNKGICARDIEYADACEAVRAIKEDGGIAVLAHPGQLDSYEFVEELVHNGLDGIEIYHLSHGDKDYDLIKDLSIKYNLILTGGSDFHGRYGEDNIAIGDIKSPKGCLNVFGDK